MAHDLVVSASAAFTPAQLQIIKRSVAPDTNNDEFDLFVETCKLYGLNPMKRQIGARVYSKDNPKKRRMAIVTEIGGFRAIAARAADYRPDEEEPHYTYNPELKGPTNPLGIERAKVCAFKMDENKVWQRVVGVAYWDEFAPVEDEWGEDRETGKRRPTGKQSLGGNWVKMPRLMIAKCAEAQALRKGWPEDLSGLYEAAETDRADIVEGTATDVLDQVAADDRLRKIGSPKNGYAIQWELGEPLEMVAPGALADRIEGWLRSDDRHSLAIKQFKATNQPTLNRFWADSPSDALELKKLFERRETELTKAEREPVVAQ